MSLQVQGKLHVSYPTEQRTATFSAREFILEIQDGNYPQYIKFQLTQDRCGLIDAHKVGDTVTVFFDLRGRELNGKYFTNLVAWKIVDGNGQQETRKQAAPYQPAAAPPATTAPANVPYPNADDLPF